MLPQIKNKKGVSIMVGYILLISISVVMSIIIYQWIKTYVPNDLTDCPDGASILIKELSFANVGGSLYELNLTLKNNGRFNLAGYFIHATNSPEQELATVDLSSGKTSSGGILFGSAILFSPGEQNTLELGEEKETTFNINSQIYSVEILPLRFQSEKNKNKLVSCGNAKAKEVVSIA